MIVNLAGWAYAGITRKEGLPIFYVETLTDVEELRKKWGDKAIIRINPTLYEIYRAKRLKPPLPPEVPSPPKKEKLPTPVFPAKPPTPAPPAEPPLFKYLLIVSLLAGGLGIILYLKKKK